ncbi:MAG: MarR family transcriptional regulator [Solirubrobacterales bacterium]|nr:MarR family transcriptional regulator [Solirubrobacterales bacterium]
MSSSDTLAADLRSTLTHLFRRLRQTKSTGDLSLSESSALSRLQKDGPTTSAQLAKAEQISPQSMGAIIASLAEAGLIQRSHDPADGRRQIVSLTAAGDAKVQEKRSARLQQLSRVVSELTPEQRAQLTAALPVLEHIADEL